MAARQNTKLESEGAEFLVLGLLLIEGIAAYKAYTNFRGYDLTAINTDTQRVARIQVKSRWATDYPKSFLLKNLDCDFIVHVALNRGFRPSKKNNVKSIAIKLPTFYIFPVDVLKKIRNENGWQKVRIREVADLENYIDNWKLIKEYLVAQ